MCLDHIPLYMHVVLNRQGLHVRPGICHQAPLSAGTDCACYHSALAYVFWAFTLGYRIRLRNVLLTSRTQIVPIQLGTDNSQVSFS